MKKLLLVLLVLSSFSFAQAKEPWQQELDSIQTEIKSEPTSVVAARWTIYVSGGLAVCLAKSSLIATSLISDTLPAVNGVSEALANLTSDEYQSLQSQTILGSMGEALLGVFAAPGAFVADLVNLVFMTLKGDWNQFEFKKFKGTYESTFKLAEELNADKALCSMVSQAEKITRFELKKRFSKSQGAELDAAAAILRGR